MTIRYNGKLFSELTLEEARAALEEMVYEAEYDYLPSSFQSEREPEKPRQPSDFTGALSAKAIMWMHEELFAREIRDRGKVEQLLNGDPESQPAMSTLIIRRPRAFGAEE